MSFDFTVKEFILGVATGTPTFQFYRRGFNLGGGGSQPTWKDIILHGNTALTLVNSKANGLNYLKLYGGCEQTGTPTPNNPIDIVCNNGTLKMIDNELPEGYKRVLGYECDNNVLWQITGFKLRGSDTVRISFSVNAACNVFGCYQGTDATDNYDLYVSVTSGSKYLRYGGGTYLSYWSSSNLGERFDVVFSSTGTSGMPQDSTWAPLTFESANNLLLGGTTLMGTSSKLKGNLYGNFIVDNRLKLIPCERVSDNVLGYYDTYSETFYEPTGTPTSLGYDGSHYVLTVDGMTETVEVYGNNIFNKNDTANISNWYSGANQTIAQAAANETLVMRAKPNTTYYFKHCSVKGGCRAFYTEVEDWEIGSAFSTMSGNAATNANVVYSITTSANAKWIFFNYGRNNLEASFDDQRNDFMVSTSELTSDTPYEPYFNGGSAMAEMLLAIDDNKDEHNVTSGDVIRKIGIKIFDGSETFTASTAYGKACLIQGASNSWGAYRSEAVLCTHFLGMPTTTSKAEDYTCFFNVTGHFYFRLEDNTVATFKQFLADQYNAGTPVIVFFVKATPTTETVTAQPLTIQAGTNIVEITQASIDNLELEVSYKAGVEVTVTEIENAQLDNSVEVTVNK